MGNSVIRFFTNRRPIRCVSYPMGFETPELRDTQRGEALCFFAMPDGRPYVRQENILY